MTWFSNKAQGTAGTIVIHAIVVAILLLTSFAATLPSDQNEGLQINFGNSEDGFGAIEPKVNYDNAVIISLPSRSDRKKVEDKNILTQDHEDAPAIITKKKETKKEPKKPVVKETKEEPKVETKEVVKEETKIIEPPREVNKKALFPGKKEDGGTTGEGVTGKEGNQGALEGSPDSKNRTGGATGGDGIGEGDGIGISFDLRDRKSLSLPKPVGSMNKKGTVVIRVTVDKQGKVTKVELEQKGSTTLDYELLNAAKKAAMSAKFDVSLSPNAPAYQTGTITYIFKLQ
ncbi:MAG: energy transducer TonB [Tenuifilaceae bacterium]